MSEQDLGGKVAIVTGAGRNIGRAIALRLARSGAAVIINARSNAREADEVVRTIETAGGKAARVLGDVADPKSAEALAATAMQRFGRIDILVNNAALRREKSFAEMTFAEWREVMDVVLDGAFHCVKACLPALRRNGGAIVNIGGWSAHVGAAHRTHVMTAKAGLVGFTRGLAHDLAADRIWVNCVVPGAIETPRPQSAPRPAHHGRHGTITGERGTPEDVAALVHFLCTPAAHFVTGQAVHANGGAYLGA